MKSTDIRLSSQIKLNEAKSRQQNIWTVFAIVVTALLHWFPVDNILGESVSSFVKYGSLIFTGICMFGSLLFLFKSPSSQTRNYSTLSKNSSTPISSYNNVASSNFSKDSSLQSPVQNRYAKREESSSPTRDGNRISVNYRGMGHTEINTMNAEAIDSVSNRIWETRQQHQDQDETPRHGRSPLHKHAGPPYQPHLDATHRKDLLFHDGRAKSVTTSKAKLSPATRYIPSPSSESDSPIGWANKIAASAGHQLVRIMDPFPSIGLRDEGMVDSWTENLKYVLGKHVHDVIRRFDIIVEQTAQRIVIAAANRPPARQLDINEIRRLLSFSTPSPQLEGLVAFARDLRVSEIEEYCDHAALFCPLGVQGIKNVKPSIMKRMRQLAQSHDRYLRIDANPDVIPGHASRLSQSPLSRQQGLEDDGAGSDGVCDADIAMKIFFHLCDMVVGHERFSTDHYVPNVANIPMHRPSSGASTIQIGIVRSVGGSELGSHGPSNAVSFSVYTVRGLQSTTGYADVWGDLDQRHVDKDGKPMHIGRQVLVVDPGRHNCYEAILLLLLQLVRLNQIHVSDAASGSSSGMMGLLLEILSSSSGKELLHMLRDLGIQLE